MRRFPSIQIAGAALLTLTWGAAFSAAQSAAEEPRYYSDSARPAADPGLAEPGAAELRVLVPRQDARRPESFSGAEEARLTPLVQSIQQAETASEAVDAYAAALSEAPDGGVLFEETYMRRMIELGAPHLAEAQAEDLLSRNPENGLAWAVLAYSSGAANDTSAALAEIATAMNFAPNDEFVQRTAGQLIAWYDVLGKPDELPDKELRDALEHIRADFKGRQAFAAAYNAAREVYEGGGGEPVAGAEVEAAERDEYAAEDAEEEDARAPYTYRDRPTARTYDDSGYPWYEDGDYDDDGYSIYESRSEGYTVRRYDDDDDDLNFGFSFGWGNGLYGSGYYGGGYYGGPGYDYYDPYATYTYLYRPRSHLVIVPRVNRYVLRERPVHRYLRFSIGHRDRYYAPTRQRFVVNRGVERLYDRHTRGIITPRFSGGTRYYGGTRYGPRYDGRYSDRDVYRDRTGSSRRLPIYGSPNRNLRDGSSTIRRTPGITGGTRSRTPGTIERGGTPRGTSPRVGTTPRTNSSRFLRGGAAPGAPSRVAPGTRSPSRVSPGTVAPSRESPSPRGGERPRSPGVAPTKTPRGERSFAPTPRSPSTALRNGSPSPSATLRSPSTMFRSPTTTLQSPSTTLQSPSTTLRSRSSTPSTTWRSPSTASRSPSTTLRSPNTTFRSPSGAVRSPSGAVRSPSGALRSPSTTLRTPGRDDGARIRSATPSSPRPSPGATLRAQPPRSSPPVASASPRSNPGATPRGTKERR